MEERRGASKLRAALQALAEADACQRVGVAHFQDPRDSFINRFGDSRFSNIEAGRGEVEPETRVLDRAGYLLGPMEIARRTGVSHSFVCRHCKRLVRMP